MARQEPDADRDYPVNADMGRWMIRELCDRDFDITAMDGLECGQFEGHAFSFIHRRYLQGLDLPVVPVIVNTFDPPNQPTPRRCIQLGAALRDVIAAYPEDLRVGVLASGGLRTTSWWMPSWTTRSSTRSAGRTPPSWPRWTRASFRQAARKSATG
ncbi:hypothetical protein ACTMU2_18755 [Cupriavidus basilensis]